MDTQNFLKQVRQGISRHLEQGGTYSELAGGKLKLSTIRWIHQGRTENPGILTVGEIAKRLGIGG